MTEKIFNFTLTDEKIIEKIVNIDDVMLNHVVLPGGERLPKHNADSNVYLIVVRGELTLQLNDQDPKCYGKGNIINAPYDTRMNVYNDGDDVVEFFIVKAPGPNSYGK